MSKNSKKSLEAMDADQVTEKLGDYLEKLGGMYTDKEKGMLRTAFNTTLLAQKVHSVALIHVAAEKNGVQSRGVVLDDIAAAVADAAEARGSQSAAKVRDYLQLQERFKAKARELVIEENAKGSGWIKTVIRGTKAYKQL
jgi:hypothetical protein